MYHLPYCANICGVCMYHLPYCANICGVFMYHLPYCVNICEECVCIICHIVLIYVSV